MIRMGAGPWEGPEKWEGGVVGGDGCLYAMPQQVLPWPRALPCGVGVWGSLLLGRSGEGQRSRLCQCGLCGAAC